MFPDTQNKIIESKAIKLFTKIIFMLSTKRRKYGTYNFWPKRKRQYIQPHENQAHQFEKYINIKCSKNSIS